GQISEPALLQSAAALHRQLRPMLPEDSAAYLAKMQRVCRYGARLVLACNEQGQPVGLALYRLYENTYEDLRLYVDDLVTDEAARSQGVG
ncbi:GNAT family N-acetyltransferase, partial [Limimaricola sp. G21655-S1]|uniref:GNAT family N-acetyltransferase n=1 Tax=Limimaricola sp. G21655-S1 TaxID=3014768 RepID=UPI0022C9ED4A|nr:GNAT family N-acetyltransferase [Limimaricola sp. G21655-S1]